MGTGGRSAERFAFRQTANVAQAFGHDAQAWAKYQCQLCGVNFQGDFARQFKTQLRTGLFEMMEPPIPRYLR